MYPFSGRWPPKRWLRVYLPKRFAAPKIGHAACPDSWRCPTWVISTNQHRSRLAFWCRCASMMVASVCCTQFDRPSWVDTATRFHFPAESGTNRMRLGRRVRCARPRRSVAFTRIRLMCDFVWFEFIHKFKFDFHQVWGECRLIQTHAEMAVMPVIGFVNDFNLDRLRINPDEVAEVFTVPLEVLCDPSNMRHTQFRLNRTGYSVTAFLGGRYRVWGLTGGLTHLLLTSLLPDDLYGKRNVPFVRPLRV